MSDSLSWLMHEFLRVRVLAQSPEVAAALKACGLDLAGPRVFGVAFVEVLSDSGSYLPGPGGSPAIIVPVFEGGVLVDLTAFDLHSRRTATRCGAADILGWDAIERAKDTGSALTLHRDPIQWLRGRGHGAVVLNWQTARSALADVPGFVCADETLAHTLDNALRRPFTVPPIFVKDRHRAAA